MNNPETTFSVESVSDTIENQPYLEPAAREALIIWFDANDSIEPVFIDREEWEEKREKGTILEEKSDKDTGKQKLYIAQNINLFEMIDVIEAVDKDTFKDNPELATQGVEKIKKLADTFKKAGVYIHESVGYVQEGKDIAEELSNRFFNYGLSLESKTQKTNEPIPPTELSEEERRELDKWLIGKERYYRVMSRLGPNPSQEDIDRERQKHFKGYFKALSSKGSKEDGNQPWERSIGPAAKIQEKAEENIRRRVHEPDLVLYGTASTRSNEMMKNKMKAPITTDEEKGEDQDQKPITEHQTLYEKLEIPRLKEELETVRRTGNIEEISKKEFEIAKKIREEINTFEYKNLANNPSEIIKDNYLNCLGSTLIGTSLLDEVGIKYLIVDYPSHIMTLLATSDRKLYWQDFTPTKNREPNLMNDTEVTANMFEGNPDILTLAENSDSFNVFLKPLQKTYNISSSTDAKKHVLLNNLSGLMAIENPKAALEILRRNTEFNPNSATVQGMLGNILFSFGLAEEEKGNEQEAEKAFMKAEEAYIKAIEINSNNHIIYSNLAGLLYNQERLFEAGKVYEKATEIGFDTTLYKNYKKFADDLIKRSRWEEAGIAYNNLGKALIRNKQYEEAVKILETGAILYPKHPTLQQNLGDAYYQFGDFEKAKEAYIKASESDPDNPRQQQNLGDAYHQLRDFEKAKEAYLKASESDPNNHILQISLGNTYYELGDYDKAKEAYLTAIEINPNKPIPYVNLGYLLTTIGDLAGAADVYRKGLQHNPENDFLQRKVSELK